MTEQAEHSRGEASQEKQENRRDDERFRPTNRFALALREKINGWCKSKIRADPHGINAGKDREARSVSKSPNDKGESAQSVPCPNQPADPMHSIQTK